MWQVDRDLLILLLVLSIGLFTKQNGRIVEIRPCAPQKKGMLNLRMTNDNTETETLYYRDDALLYIAYVMLIWAAAIPADRWHCSLWP